MSYFAWVDYDEQQRKRVNTLLKLFNESEARDELGLGGIRDRFSDLFFPGTNTIQTRLRYVFFISWIYKEIENEETLTSRAFVDETEKRERDLIEPLKKTDSNEWGIFGKRDYDVQRLPSSVYWDCLNKWGIRTFDGTINEYSQQLKILYANNSMIEHDKEKLSLWDKNIPKPTDNWDTKISFDLTKEEAEYIKDKIKIKCHNSLFPELFTFPKEFNQEYIWDLDIKNIYDEEKQKWINQSELFSKTIYGASILYNYYLSVMVEADRKEDIKTPKESSRWVSDYKKEFIEWAKKLIKIDKHILSWDLKDFWTVLNKSNSQSNITQSAIKFVSDWLGILKNNPDWTKLIDLKASEDLIKNREMELKRRTKNSRFEKQKVRARWRGASGLRPLSFRWDIAKTYLNEIRVK